MRLWLELWGLDVLTVHQVGYTSFWTTLLPSGPEPWKGQRLSEQFNRFQASTDDRTHFLQNILEFPLRKAVMRVLPCPHQCQYDFLCGACGATLIRWRKSCF